MYRSPFYITGLVGNNTFSYDKRVSKSLYVPSLIDGNFSDVRQGVEVVFEDTDEKNILRSCAGLEHFVRTNWEGIPMIVFDNHNHALYFWYEAQAQGIIGTRNTLVHIDEHSDLWKNEKSLPKNPTLKQVFHFTNYECNVGNYIEPALEKGIVGKMLRIEDTIGMEKYGSYEK
jgi:hypothetical protein